MAQPGTIVFELAELLTRRDAAGGIVLNDEMLDAASVVDGRTAMWLALNISAGDKKRLTDTDMDKLGKVFSSERMFDCPDLTERRADVKTLLSVTKTVGCDRSGWLLMTANQRLAVYAINNGFLSAVIVSPERLRRELLLRNMTAQHYTMHTRPK